ncbi:protein FAR1-RELATED SEQUENCE 5-like [Salvia hispanica]|uniref:protein FAR1-RELATED SEQUENCE 5-like n=1 Tax=Salvia hispanica TaxID=49212 RepID=UPI002009A543|nr:protein FAR1-RELATED SEQUENCE 5-like [Salvia hispanica]XP_047963849.1 protein FAR1-RELATED SEQUENCE 5-like [Salvia hispanica]
MDAVPSFEVMYKPVCKDEFKPCVGKKFKTVEDAIVFYNYYARAVGFDTRKSGTKCSGDVITWQYLVCSREGQKRTVDGDATNARQGFANKRRRASKRCGCNARISFKYFSDFGVSGYVIHQFVEEHNHSMVEAQHKKFMRLNRKPDQVHRKFIEDCAKVNIGSALTSKLLNELMEGYDVGGCTIVLDVEKCARDMKANIEGSDTQMLLDVMRRKKETCGGFTFEFDLDAEDKLNQLFWCDSVSRKNYHYFGDVISFDTTYSTNRYNMIFASFTGKDNHARPVTFAAGLLCKEDVDSFSWLLSCFVRCMGASPKLITIDQDSDMKVAVERVLVNTRHRWCLWHTMLKLADQVPKNLLANEDFKNELNARVWSDLIEPIEFEESWKGIMERYGLEKGRVVQNHV